jgi:hypothetical protein
MTDRFSDRNLIFLISQQRAGSTLLQRILAGHPDVHTTAETWLMLHPVYALRKEGHQAEYNATLAHRALQDFLDTLVDKEVAYLEALRHFASHLYGSACDGVGKAYFLDKTPRYYYIIPELARIFPQAKFVVLLRNPLAVLSSILSTWVKGHWVLLARYRDDLVEAPARLAAGIKLLRDRVSVVHYEHLVSEPAAQVEEVCSQLGLTFHPDMLAYGQGERPKGGMGDPTGINRYEHASIDRVEKWVDLGRASQTRHFAQGYLQTLGPDLLSALGYDYAELETKLLAVPCVEGAVTVSWRQIVKPDQAFRNRQFWIELALLEHQRMVHRLRRWKRALVGR